MACTLVGVNSMTTCPGPLLRRPNSSARSGPMYRAPMSVATRTVRSGSSSTMRAVASIFTKAYGGASRSTTRQARGSAASAAVLAEPRPVSMRIRPSSSYRNHTGTTVGLPDRRFTASLAVRVPSRRKACQSASDISRTVVTLAGRGGCERDQAGNVHALEVAVRHGVPATVSESIDGRPVAVLDDVDERVLGLEPTGGGEGVGPQHLVVCVQRGQEPAARREELGLGHPG